MECSDDEGQQVKRHRSTNQVEFSTRAVLGDANDQATKNIGGKEVPELHRENAVPPIEGLDPVSQEFHVERNASSDVELADVSRRIIDVVMDFWKTINSEGRRVPSHLDKVATIEKAFSNVLSAFKESLDERDQLGPPDLPKDLIPSSEGSIGTKSPEIESKERFPLPEISRLDGLVSESGELLRNYKVILFRNNLRNAYSWISTEGKRLENRTARRWKSRIQQLRGLPAVEEIDSELEKVKNTIRSTQMERSKWVSLEPPDDLNKKHWEDEMNRLDTSVTYFCDIEEVLERLRSPEAHGTADGSDAVYLSEDFLDTSREPLIGGQWSLPHVPYCRYRMRWFEDIRHFAIEEGHDWSTEDDLMRIPHALLYGTGLEKPGQTKKDLVLFSRVACKEQVKFITETVIEKGRNAFIYGQPGTGKSSTTLFGCCTLRQDYDIVWIGMNPQRGFVTVKTIQGNYVMNLTVIKENVQLNLRQQILEDKNRRTLRTVLILDGFNMSDPPSAELVAQGLKWQSNDATNRRLITVSSMGNGQNRASCIPEGFTRHGVGSWSLYDYLQAVSNQELWKNVREFFADPELAESRGIELTESERADLVEGMSREERVKVKFYFAGSCVRYMFGSSIDTIKTEVSDAIATMSSNIMDATVGEWSHSGWFRHRLISFTYESGYEFKRTGFVSQYVARAFGVVCKSTQIQTLYKMCDFATNPIARGWIFEAFFLACAAETEELVVTQLLFDGEESELVWTCHQPQHARVMRFYPDTLSAQVPLETWLRPDSPRNPGFDAVILLPNGTIRFIQTTAAKEHDMKLWALADFVKLLRFLGHHVTEAEVFFVIPNQLRAKDFKINNIEGWGTFARLFPSWPRTETRAQMQIAMIRF